MSNYALLERSQTCSLQNLHKIIRPVLNQFKLKMHKFFFKVLLSFKVINFTSVTIATYTQWQFNK